MSPTLLAMSMRKQWSDEHLFQDDGYTLGACARCGRRRNHSDHVTREEDKAAVKRWRDRINESREA